MLSVKGTGWVILKDNRLWQMILIDPILFESEGLSFTGYVENANRSVTALTSPKN